MQNDASKATLDFKEIRNQHSLQLLYTCVREQTVCRKQILSVLPVSTSCAWPSSIRVTHYAGFTMLRENTNYVVHGV